MWTKRNPRTPDEHLTVVAEVKAALEGEGLAVERMPEHTLRVTVDGEVFLVEWSNFWLKLVLVGTLYDSKSFDGVRESQQSYRYGCKASTLAKIIRKRAAARPAMRLAYAAQRAESERQHKLLRLQVAREEKALARLRRAYPGVIEVAEVGDKVRVTFLCVSVNAAENILVAKAKS